MLSYERAPKLSRRLGIKLMAGASAAVMASQLDSLPDIALAQASYPDNETTWQIHPTGFWYPSTPGVKSDGGNLYRKDGPLDDYDRVNNYQTNVRGAVESIYQEKAAKGELYPWSGFCWATANVNARLGYLETSQIISSEQSAEIRQNSNKFGLLVAISAGDVAKRKALGSSQDERSQNNDDNLNALAKDGRVFVARMEYLPGIWYFVVRAIKDNQVIVSGFDKNLVMPIENIYDSYVPVRFNEAQQMKLSDEQLYEQYQTRFSQRDMGFNDQQAAELAGVPSY